MVEYVPSLEYDARTLSQELDKYAALQKKTRTLSAEKLKNSPEYHQMLIIARNLSGLTIPGEKLLELTDYLVGESGIYTHHIYEELAQEHRELAEKHEGLNERYVGLLKKLERELEPFSEVLGLAKILEEEREIIRKSQ